MRLNDKVKLLQSVIQKRYPKLAVLAAQAAKSPLSDDQLEALRHVVLDELLENGLDNDDEPTPYGEQLDDVAGWLTPDTYSPPVPPDTRREDPD